MKELANSINHNEKVSGLEEFSELYLTEVDHLNRLRQPDGNHSKWVRDGVQQNLVPAVKEGAMLYAVSTTYQKYENGTYWWLDQTPEQVAASGLLFHKDPAALARVEVEVEEAKDTLYLQPGFIKVFISPKMSAADAPYEVAHNEHLGDEDMVRIHMVDTGTDGQPLGKFMQSLLVRDIPLSAWVKMLHDPNNIFGKSVSVQDETSALSLMQVYRELQVPESALPEGVISIIEAVLPYADKDSQTSINQQLELFRCDQAELHRRAENLAARWLNFEVALADSLYDGYANDEIKDFIEGLAFAWENEFVIQLLSLTLPDGNIQMTRALAAKLEASKRNTLFVSGAVITNNKKILSQLNAEVAQSIYVNELFIQTMMLEGNNIENIRRVEVQNDQVIAKQNIYAGGGCPGQVRGAFENSHQNSPGTLTADQKCPEVKNGQVVRCPGCKQKVKAIVPDRETIYCSNKNCKLADPGIKAIQKTEQSTRSQIKRPKSVSTDFQPNHPEQPEEHQHSARNIQQKGRLALVGAL